MTPSRNETSLSDIMDMGLGSPTSVRTHNYSRFHLALSNRLNHFTVQYSLHTIENAQRPDPLNRVLLEIKTHIISTHTSAFAIFMNGWLHFIEHLPHLLHAYIFQSVHHSISISISITPCSTSQLLHITNAIIKCAQLKEK